MRDIDGPDTPRLDRGAKPGLVLGRRQIEAGIAAHDAFAPGRKAIALRPGLGAENKTIGHFPQRPRRSTPQFISEWIEEAKTNQKVAGINAGFSFGLVFSSA